MGEVGKSETAAICSVLEESNKYYNKSTTSCELFNYRILLMRLGVSTLFGECRKLFWPLLGIYIIHIVSGLKNRASILARGPPSDIIDDTSRGDSPNENGIRLVTKKECSNTISRWFKKLGLVSGSSNIEYLSALIDADRFSQLMPGIKPRRIEMIAFGEFVDGRIECLASACWHKNTCPAEIEVLNIIQSPNPTVKNLDTSMTNFISELCRENAIFPNFTSLEKLSHLKKLNFHDSLRKFGWDYNSIELSSSSAGKLVYIPADIDRLYTSVNKSPVLCLDGLTKDVDLGHFWYETKITHLSRAELVVSLYFRCKKYNEYEISFARPTTGTDFGSGTVGGALVLPADSAAIEGKVPVRREMVLQVVEAIKSKINHPRLS